MRDFLKTFTNRYKSNCETSYELDQSLMQDVSFAEWKDSLLTRSSKVRAIFQQNEDLLKELENILETPLDTGSAWELYYGLWDLYFGAYDDLYIMRAMALPLISFYEERQDYEKLVFLYHLLAFENFEFYERMLGGNEVSEAMEYYRKVISLRKYYADIMDPKIRKYFFTAYNNIIVLYCHTKEKAAQTIFDTYHEAMDFWNSDVVQQYDSNDDMIREAVTLIADGILYMEEYAVRMTEEQQQQFREIIREDQKWFKTDNEGNMFRALIRCRLLEGEDPHRLIKDLIKHIKTIPEPDYDNQETAVCRLLDKHNTAVKVFDYFRCGDVSPEDQESYMAEFFQDVTDMHTHIPSGYWTSMIDNLCVDWYKSAAPYLKKVDAKVQLLQKLVISRQPITYIHTIMVSEIATRIARSMIHRNPNYFAGILMCKTADDVRRKGVLIVDYIKKCAELHDVGKCELVEVINRQNRKLSDAEFMMIRKHPEKGLEFLNNDPDFAPFYDVMLGHHRTYDGKGGYPMTFDNTKSKVRCIIDLITVADCSDAATDILGRNYAKGKDFDHLYEELKEGAGTQYNPDIVDLIGNDAELYEDLRYLTREGRQEVYYRAYMEIFRSRQ